jgi:TonB-dependent starch-binding outer membrane protein SusC
MKKLRPIISRFILLVAISSLAVDAFPQQGIVVSGKIISISDGAGIPYATIALLDQNSRVLDGVASDLDGNYSIRVPSDGRLQFSFVGHTTQVVDVNGRQIINIRLEESTQTLEEVRITAIGKKGPVNTGYSVVPQRDITGSIASLNMEQMAKVPITNVEQMLQGQIPGVQIITNSGDPGAGVTVRIRGNTSATGRNEPLYIVDGVPYLSHSSDAGNAISNRSRSPIADINPNDIEKIDVLKDASATAIYGSRAANGVVIITTKRGRKGKTRVNFNSSWGLRTPPRHIPLNSGNSYKILQLEGYQNAGVRNHQALEYLRDDPNASWYEEYNNNTDWIKALEQTTVVQNYNANVRGGGEYTAYSFSLSYLNEPGSIINTGYNRLSGRFNLDYRVSDKLRFGNSISYARGRLQNPRVNRYNPYAMAFTKAPNLSIFKQDSLGNDLTTYFNPQRTYIQPYGTFNPVAFNNSIVSNTVTNNLTTSIFAIYNPFRNFNITSRVSMNFGDNDNFGFIPAEATGLVWGNELINSNSYANHSHTDFAQENIFAYKNNFGDTHELSATFVTSMEISKEDEFFNNASNTGSEYLQRINSSTRWFKLNSSRGDNALISLTGEVRYTLLDRYLFTGTMRRDGSSKFGEENRFGWFPAFSLAWRLSSESFLQDVDLITDLKIRASYGANGRQPDGNYRYLGTYSSSGRYMNYSTVAADNIQLNHLSWETSIQKNIGFDLSMWNDRLTIINDWYIKRTHDLLYEQPIPGSTGFETVLQNFGDIDNKGFDLGVDVYILQGNLNWNMNFNISRNLNYITRLSRGIPIEGERIGKYIVKAGVGDAIGSFYGLRYLGVYARDEDAKAKDANGNIIYDFDGQPKYMRFNNRNGYTFRGGDAIYEDINNDGLINELDYVKIGDSNPKFFGGITNNFSFQDFTLTLFFEYKYGHQVINMARMRTENLYDQNNQSTATLRRWRKQGDVTDIPRAIFERGHNWEGSDRFVEDASYIRLRTGSLSYNIPDDLVRRLRIENLQVFLSTFNIYTWTRYTGADPEIGIDGRSPLAVGVDNSRTSLPRIFTLGLDLTF